jgi:NAD(P)-dependent dehydrogenase (short-subunit alcohol dehydrogenase family)
VGGKGLFVKTDVSREDEIAALVARTVEQFGRFGKPEEIAAGVLYLCSPGADFVMVSRCRWTGDTPHGSHGFVRSV